MKKIIVFLSLLVLASCAKETDCKTGGLNIGFNSLNPTENDTIWIRSYAKGGGFSAILVEKEYIFYSNQDSMNGVENGTSIKLEGNSTFHEWDRNNSGFLNADYDYRVQLGSSVYEISNMQVEKKTKKCGGLLSLECPDCHNPVTKFLLSGSEKTVTANEVYFLD